MRGEGCVHSVQRVHGGEDRPGGFHGGPHPSPSLPQPPAACLVPPRRASSLWQGSRSPRPTAPSLCPGSPEQTLGHSSLKAAPLNREETEAREEAGWLSQGQAVPPAWQLQWELRAQRGSAAPQEDTASEQGTRAPSRRLHPPSWHQVPDGERKRRGEVGPPGRSTGHSAGPSGLASSSFAPMVWGQPVHLAAEAEG